MSIQSEIDRLQQNISDTYTSLSAFGVDMPSARTSENLAATAETIKAVLYSEQNLTDEQKAQARENIGATSSDEVAPLIIAFTTNAGGEFEADKTITEVTEAQNAGRTVWGRIMQDDNTHISIPLIYAGNLEGLNIALFIAALANTSYIIQMIGDSAIQFEELPLLTEYDMPTALPNPNALVFTGAVTGTYDGSSRETIYVPTIAGEKGEPGRGIANVRYNADDTLTLIFDDETEWTTPIGLKGMTGKSITIDNIVESELNGKRSTTITFSDDSEITINDGVNGTNGKDGAQGFGIVASVDRPSFTSAQWDTYGTIGREENWGGTSNSGVRVGDIFVVVGTATDTGVGHQLVYKYTGVKGGNTLSGVCLAHHLISSKGANGAAGKDGAKGDTGARGFGIYKVTTAPSSYTTATGGFTPTYRLSLSTAKTQSKATEFFVGDTILYSYYLYPVGYVDGSYLYLGARVSIRGSTGSAGAVGATPQLSIGTVTTLAAGENASATITGTAENPVLNLYIPKGADGEGSEAETETILSDNLFDKTTAVSGKLFYHSSSGPSLIDDAHGYYAYVPLRGAGTYRTKLNQSQHGDSYGTRVPILKADKTFLQNVTGTLTNTGDRYAYDLEFTITEAMIASGAALYAFDCHKNILDTVMIVKDREYPSEYIPYGYIEIEVEGDNVNDKQNNILKGKTAVFLGDSICAGTTTLASAPEYGYGWGGLIGEANRMTWKNFGRNGGTIAPISSVDEARWVPKQVDLALAQYPNADYVIFEGGANDAGILGESNLGTFSASGYAPTDTSTFTGAFEVLVLKILNSFPNAKIGYIVAQKMGVSNDYGSANNRYRKFFDRAVEICQKWGIPVIDLWNETPLNPKLAIHYDSSLTADQANENGKCYTDGQHLTLTGYKKLQNPIEEFMRRL